MILKRPKEELDEIKEFNTKFKGRIYGIKTNGVKILEVKTDDDEIIKWLKQNGF